jgi:ATP-binding cassette subfamily A (ABC1) protein 3
MTINIPSIYASHFAEFFSQFDKALAELEITGYGISLSTLEEVFMKVGHLEDEEYND